MVKAGYVAMRQFVEVVFNIPIHKSFIYAYDQPVTAGCRVLAPFKNRKLMGAVISVFSQPPAVSYPLKEIHAVVDEKPVFDQKLVDLAAWMSKVYLCALGEALMTMLPGGKRERNTFEVKLNYTPAKQAYELAPQQTRAIATILAEPKGTFYVQGVTGSGKTEVFLQIAKKVIAGGRGVIYLVPEISLIPQMVDTFHHEFKNKMAVLHSGLTGAQRLKEWRKIMDGEILLVIGARSAVFAPVKDLGLIIMDEEHETSYKAGSTPRYHARQLAAYRCEKEGARFVMGSATPSLDAYYRMETEQLVRIELPLRLSGGIMPKIKIVDMKKEKGSLSRELVLRIKEAHDEGRQSILFLNRRGFAYLFFCKSCGFEMKCRYCSVSLTFHKKRNQMICHYCGYRAQPAEVCPECGSLDIGYSGFGTEKIEEELQTVFPDLRIKRIDTDAVRKKEELNKSLAGFYHGEVDVLLGTQMVAKGLNFPGVKLVGIISADQGLQLPDFRSLERTFALILQVAGRAGRMMPDGQVIVQTFKPNHNVILKASRGEFREFYLEEIEMRKMLKFPPFFRLIRLVLRSKEEKQVIQTARKLKGLWEEKVKKQQDSQSIEILGPVECPLAMISNNYRYHCIFRSTHFMKLHGLLKEVVSQFTLPKGVYLEIDVDPISLL
jgi:primosomal protein N' (replication factor Y)